MLAKELEEYTKVRQRNLTKTIVSISVSYIHRQCFLYRSYFTLLLKTYVRKSLLLFSMYWGFMYKRSLDEWINLHLFSFHAHNPFFILHPSPWSFANPFAALFLSIQWSSPFFWCPSSEAVCTNHPCLPKSSAHRRRKNESNRSDSIMVMNFSSGLIEISSHRVRRWRQDTTSATDSHGIRTAFTTRAIKRGRIHGTTGRSGKSNVTIFPPSSSPRIAHCEVMIT